MKHCVFCNRLIDYHEIIECITGALDAKDPYTAGHSQRVSDMALRICRHLRLSDDLTQSVHIAAHLHDIGKIGIPDAILNKRDKLDEREWEIVRRHPQIGADILSRSSHLAQMGDIILHHHERFDGLGYPAGLQGEKIPLGARIVAICDSIDAMNSDRSYRRAHPLEYCYREIERNLGSMYDPAIGAVVLSHWREITRAGAL